MTQFRKLLERWRQDGRPLVMGILNVTPDSFSDGGRFLDREAALVQARRLVAEGADILDVGGESTRPGAAPVPEAEERARVVPVIETLARMDLPVAISVDTSKPGVMAAAVEAGASLINDVRALREPGALAAAARLGVPVCLMHMQGEPRTMQDNPYYADVVTEVHDFLVGRAQACEAAGIPREDILLDPGFGFGKRLEHNLALLKHLERLTDTEYPVLVGMSRKRMIGEVLDLPVDRRLHGGLALAVIAAMKGAAVIRVHDVGPTVEALKMTHAVMTVE